MPSMQQKISNMLFEQGKTLKDASLAVGKSHSYLQHFIKLGKPRRLPSDVRQRLAHFLNVPEEELRDSSIEPSETKSPASYASPATALHIGDIPVLSRLSLSGMVMDRVNISEYVSRPDYLRGVAEAFAVYMMDDTMEPRFYRGELLYCHPTRPPVRGEAVVIEFNDLTATVRELVLIEPRTISVKQVNRSETQPSPHFSCSEINALPLNGQQAVTAISALWLRRSVAFRWLQQPIGRHLMIDVVEKVIERHPEVKNEGIPEGLR